MKYWFKRKQYGWGWQPASLEGWLVTLSAVVGIVWISLIQRPDEFLFFVYIAMIVIALIVICYLTGETPEWSWGKK